MWRRFLAMGFALIIVLAATAGTTVADEDDSRLGGAYRGPYEDNNRVKSEEEPDSSDQSADSGGPTGPDTGDQGAEDEGGGGAVDDGTGGSGEGEGEGEGEGSPAAPPPSAGTGGEGGGSEGDGGSSGPEAPDSVGGANPPAGGGGGGGAPNLQQGRGKTAQQDVQAYWMFWFEHNKEWILSELFQNRMGMDVPTSSSAWYFSGGANDVRRQPIEDADRTERILPILTDMAGHGDSWVRDAAVMALGKLGGEDALKVLLARLGKEKRLAVRQDILLALGLTQEKGAVQQLIKELENVQHRPYAALGLALLGRPDEAVPPLLKAYQTAQRSRGGASLEAAACLAVALGELGDEKIVEDLAMPIRKRGDYQLQVYACLALGKIGGDKARTWLFRALSCRDADVQGAAVLALSSWSDKAVIGHLKGKDGLKSGKRMSKLFALVSMGRIGKGLDVGDPKRKMIRMDVAKSAEGIQRNNYTAMYGALAMALMGDEASNQFFIEALNERKKHGVENISAIALTCGLLGVEDVKRDLRAIAGKKSEDQDLRGYALMALGIMGDTKSKELVRDVLSDNRPRHQVLRSGAWALGLLGDPTDVDLLLENLKREGPGFHTARGASALAIGMCGDGTSVDKLLKLISETQKNTTRAFAICALGCLVDRENVPRIPKLFMNVHYRKQYSVVKQVLSIL